jgi:hypothetical protein
MDSSRKTKIGIRRKHTSFLRRSEIGQFVRPSFFHGDVAAAQYIASSSFQYELLGDPKGSIKSIDVLETIRSLGSPSKHDGGRV